MSSFSGVVAGMRDAVNRKYVMRETVMRGYDCSNRP